MELKLLRSFVAVAEEGHFGRAAARLYLTQPPLTRQIRKLEDEVGTALFVRTPRGAELTAAGETLLADAYHLLHLAERAGERVRHAGGGTLGRLDIGLFGTGVFGVVPQLLRAFRDDHPDVQLVFHSQTKDEQIDALLHRRLDLAFNRLMQPTPGLISEVLLTEPLFVAVPSDHRLAARTAVTLADLEDEPLVLFPTGIRPSFIDRVHDLCRTAGFEARVAAEVADVVHGLVLVAAGVGVSLVTESATNLRLPGVAYRPLDERPRPRIDLDVIYRDDDRSPVLRSLLASMRATAVTLGS